MLYLQLSAYVIVLFLWALPILNPVKVMAVTFHEISHAVVALLTGGRVFGYAISPAGAGVTFGVGGNFLLILLAGYLGSCLWGVLLYYAALRWRPGACLLGLEFFFLSTAYFGWLNNATLIFGLGSMLFMTLLFWTPSWIQAMFVRLVGSACCLYAPLELVGDIFRAGRSPKVMGYSTQSDLMQLAEYLDISPIMIGGVLFILQMLLLFVLVRWSCRAAARAEIRREYRYAKLLKQRLKEVQGGRKVYVIPTKKEW